LERGAFDADDSVLVYGALQFFAFGLIFQSLHEVVARSFYADKDTFTPLWAALISAAVNVMIVGGLYLVYVNQFDGKVETAFAEWGAQYSAGDYAAGQANLLGALDDLNDQLAGVTGVGGLAIGYSTMFLIELGLLLIILRRRWHGIEERRLLLTAARTVAASVVMGIAVLAADGVLGAMGFHNAGTIRTGLRVMALTGVGGVTFVVAGALLGLREIRALPGLVLRRGEAAALAEV
jgi:putative peptidoglycan lipid II flippase